MKTVAALLICSMFCLPAHFAEAAATEATAAAAADVNARLDTLFGSHAGYEKFLDSLKASVAAKDWAAVAATVSYPIKIKIAGNRTLIRTPAQFTAHADAIFNAKVTQAVASQAYAALFATSNGVMVGDGEVWFSGICKDAACANPSIEITAINP